MLWPVIMAGGSGTRFWPESRNKKPKQFLSFFGAKTLLEHTIHRLQPTAPPAQFLVVTHVSHAPLVRKLAALTSAQILGEPVGRNTAPCAVLAALLAFKKDPSAVVGLFPADHKIGKENVFRAAVKSACQMALTSPWPVTFGIKPTCPHTGYGYLELAHKVTQKRGFEIFKLKSFHEKPNFAHATEFFRSGRFLWNSGMFVWKAERLIEAAKKYLPEAHHLAEKIVCAENINTAMKKYFPLMPNISIDYGLMEKLHGQILTMPLDLDWSDLGSWQSFSDLWPKDAQGNAAKGQALCLKSQGNAVKIEDKRLAVLYGVKDLLVVSTPDVLLVTTKEASESIREVVQGLKAHDLEQYL